MKPTSGLGWAVASAGLAGACTPEPVAPSDPGPKRPGVEVVTAPFADDVRAPAAPFRIVDGSAVIVEGRRATLSSHSERDRSGDPSARRQALFVLGVFAARKLQQHASGGGGTSDPASRP